MPQCFDTEGRFIPEEFKKIINSSEVELSKESYELNWLGKAYARLLSNEPPLTLLSEDKLNNEKPENLNSQNILIKGDNIEALKHLSGAYQEQVHMIYIDPPYNTGGDGFIYKDNRKFTPKELSRAAGIDEQEAQRILDFTESESNSHSAWLTFMYPRLYIARELLHEEGIILISIDDNELSQLKILCDSIFGPANFITTFCWEKKKKPSFLNRNLGTKFEYILAYAKSRGESPAFSVSRTTKGKKTPLNNAGNSLTQLKFPAGSVTFNMKDQVVPPQDMSENNIVTKLVTELEIVDGTNISEFILEGEWRYSQSKVDDIIENDEEITISKIPFRPNHIKGSEKAKKAHNLLTRELYSIATNEDADKEQTQIYGQKFFDYAKPTGLIKHLIKAVTYARDDALIMDFFAGSGTTAHAVHLQNAEDNFKRKYILVQLPEPIKKKKPAYNKGFRNVFELTKLRLEKLPKILHSEYPEYNGDMGFKIFEIRPLFPGYLENVKKLNIDDELELFDGSLLSDEQLNELLITWKVHDGINLTTPLSTVDLAGYKAYRHEKVLYLLNKGFTSESLRYFLTKLDSTEDKEFDIEQLIIFGYNFESKHQLEIHEAVRQYKNRKGKNVSVIVRY